MIITSFILAASLPISAVSAPQPTSPSPAPEAAIVDYLRKNLKPGEPVVVSKLFNEVFTGEAERRALNRLFNTFFKIPLYVAQAQKAKGAPPTLKEISEQFAFNIPGEADVILKVMETDPRMPRFLERDPASGEILKVDVEKILAHPRFGKILERTIAGWEGNPVPAFSVKSWDGADLTGAQMAGKPYLLYFWFTNCPPCLKTAPQLVELDKVYSAKGFTIVGLNADRLLELDYTDADRAAYAAKTGIRFKEAHATPEAQAAFGGVSVFPTMFFVDRNGIVVKHLVNAQDKATLEAGIKLALQ